MRERQRSLSVVPQPVQQCLAVREGGFSSDPCRHDFAQLPPKLVGHQLPLRIAVGAGSTPMADSITGKSPLRDGLAATLARVITIEHRQPWHIKCAGKDGEGRANAKSRGTGASGWQRAGSGLGPRRVDREQIRCAGEHSASKKEVRRASCGALKSSQSPRGNPHAPHGRMPRPRTPGRPVRLRRPHGSGGRLHARPPGLVPAVAVPGRGRALPRHRAAGLRPLHMADAFPVQEVPTPNRAPCTAKGHELTVIPRLPDRMASGAPSSRSMPPTARGLSCRRCGRPVPVQPWGRGIGQPDGHPQRVAVSSVPPSNAQRVAGRPTARPLGSGGTVRRGGPSPCSLLEDGVHDGHEIGRVHRRCRFVVAEAGDGSLGGVDRPHLQRGRRTDAPAVPVDRPGRDRAGAVGREEVVWAGPGAGAAVPRTRCRRRGPFRRTSQPSPWSAGGCPVPRCRPGLRPRC